MIHRRIGGAGVMAEQLRHLVAMSELPTVSLRVAPYAAGAHPLLGTAVAILEYDDAPDLNIVYVEQYRGTHHFMKQPAEVARCQANFAELTAKCLDERATKELIAEAAARLTA
ncbi:Scr1 family TA system antitoxin-like transcriptional regulator [Actinoplanes sp. CA-030573]|uniref:Scr1 family TA system antitoxin-like transcriptional regulator n=1 Tax=Actinoplanes sp. CA-030573 TaxID=3239898 RepID=UPI003D89B9DA